MVVEWQNTRPTQFGCSEEAQSLTQDQEEGSGRLTAVLHSAEPQGSSLKLLGFRCLEKEYHCYTSALHSASKICLTARQAWN